MGWDDGHVFFVFFGYIVHALKTWWDDGHVACMKALLLLLLVCVGGGGSAAYPALLPGAGARCQAELLSPTPLEKCVVLLPSCPASLSLPSGQHLSPPLPAASPPDPWPRPCPLPRLAQYSGRAAPQLFPSRPQRPAVCRRRRQRGERQRRWRAAGLMRLAHSLRDVPCCWHEGAGSRLGGMIGGQTRTLWDGWRHGGVSWLLIMAGTPYIALCAAG